MKIKTIEIKGYKAFYGKYSFDIGGKNIFIYGENGSGKSSFYYAIKDFFQSSNETINFNDLENIFLTKAKQGKGHIKVTFNPDKDGTDTDKLYTLSKNVNDTYTAGDTSMRDAIKLKSFLTYKHLLGIHDIKHGEEIDLFDLLVKGVLKHFKSVAVTGTKELGELWDDAKNAVDKPLEGRTYNIAQKKHNVNNALVVFNNAFKQLFEVGNPEYILKTAQPILDKFGHNLKLNLSYTQARPNGTYDKIERNSVNIKIVYLKKTIDKPHIFLNEARLSAIAISIYLGMIKRHVQGLPLKILFLDDIFIGLDISNRLPLLKILDDDFPAYQKFITTYDKPWYEFIKTTYLNNNQKWKSFEFFARRTRRGFEIPVVHEIKGPKDSSHIDYYIAVAEEYFNNGDNKAAGVYLRSSYEYILKRYCFGRVPVKFNMNTSKLDAEDFWVAVKKYKKDNLTKCNLTKSTQDDIDDLVKLTLNTLSHHDVNKHEIKSEIERALVVIKTLKNELELPKTPLEKAKITIKNLNTEVESLKSE